MAYVSSAFGESPTARGFSGIQNLNGCVYAISFGRLHHLVDRQVSRRGESDDTVSDYKGT